MSERDLVGWAVLAVAVVGWVVWPLVVVARRRRRRRTPPSGQIMLPPRPPHRGQAAEHDLTALRHPGAVPAVTVQSRPGPELFPGLADTHLLTGCPMVDATGGSMPLRDWLRHFAGVDAWPEAVSRFYRRAAADPDIAGYFGIDMARLQRHFLAALMIVAGQCVTVGLVRRMHTAHAAVRNTSGEPITEATCNAVIGVLAGVLGKLGTPPATLVALATTIAPLRAVIVAEPRRLGSTALEAPTERIDRMP